MKYGKDTAAPRARRPHRHHGRHLCPSDDAAGSEYRRIGPHRPHGFHDFRNQHQGGHLSAMTTGLRARNDQNIDTGGSLGDCVLFCAHERRHRDTVLSSHLQHDRRRHAKRVGDELNWMLKHDLKA